MLTIGLNTALRVKATQLMSPAMSIGIICVAAVSARGKGSFWARLLDMHEQSTFHSTQYVPEYARLPDRSKRSANSSITST